MPDPLGWTVLVVGALVGSLVGGVAGFGTGIIMLPLVSWAIGIRSAVPVLTVAMLIGNLSRIWWSRGEVDRAVVVRFTLGAVPATALGTAFFARAGRMARAVRRRLPDLGGSATPAPGDRFLPDAPALLSGARGVHRPALRHGGH